MVLNTSALKAQQSQSGGNRAQRRAGGTSTVDLDLEAASLRFARIVVWATLNEDGAPLFSSDDVQAVADLPHRILDPIVNVAMRLSGLEDDLEVEDATEEMAGPLALGSDSSTPSLKDSTRHPPRSSTGTPTTS